MKKLLSQVVAGIVGLWLAMMFIPGVIIKLLPTSNFFGIPLTLQWQIIVILGITSGFLNYFLKPILKILALPITILTLGLFSFVINILMIWLVDFLFTEFSAPFFYPLFYTTLIIWLLNIIISSAVKED